ncbi:MAG: hypothetical protein GYB65_16375 [Chloroflexi bacterium]|nr:hypothetical protein [Chloroflexota bacterium]
MTEGKQARAPNRRLITMLVLVLVVSIITSGCGLVNPSLKNRITRREASLREEANWLWDKWNYARVNLNPNDDICRGKRFSHDNIELSREAREDDPATARMVDDLNSAEYYINYVHDLWNGFCDTGRVDPEAMHQYLLDAYEYLNNVRLALNKPEKPPG